MTSRFLERSTVGDELCHQAASVAARLTKLPESGRKSVPTQANLSRAFSHESRKSGLTVAEGRTILKASTGLVSFASSQRGKPQGLVPFLHWRLLFRSSFYATWLIRRLRTYLLVEPDNRADGRNLPGRQPSELSAKLRIHPVLIGRQIRNQLNARRRVRELPLQACFFVSRKLQRFSETLQELRRRILAPQFHAGHMRSIVSNLLSKLLLPQSSSQSKGSEENS
ncbi:hypothetical protein B0G69_1345 [Paraburkholderia sp. RAU2J]|nr:hypothetical protein B0G69_1345 [Paraburkholderia sp. RAU2J]